MTEGEKRKVEEERCCCEKLHKTFQAQRLFNQKKLQATALTDKNQQYMTDSLQLKT